jgi:tetratricopeptide (TPR) repeat protein
VSGKIKTNVSYTLTKRNEMENYLEYIDAWFKHTLSGEEQKQFEKKISEDKVFAEEVAFYLAAKQVLNEEVIQEKKEWFRELAARHSSITPIIKQAPVKKIIIYRLAAAAAIIGVIFLSWYLFLQKPASPNELADNYIKTQLLNQDINMGSADSLQNAIGLYNNGKLDSALLQFESILQRDSSNFSAKELAGIVYLRLNNYDKALDYFRRLEKDSSYITNPAIFYQAITLMKRNQPGDKLQAQQLLTQVSEHNLEGKETADQWLDKW